MSQTFPYDPTLEGTQGLIETPMFPDTPLPGIPANIEEVGTQATLVEQSHSGKDYNDQRDITLNNIQSLGMDETRRSIAAKEREVALKAAEREVRLSLTPDTAQAYQDVISGKKAPDPKYAMEQAVVDTITSNDRKGYFTEFNSKMTVKDLAARNALYSVIGESAQNATFWDKVLFMGRELVGFINTRAVSSAVAEALDVKNSLSNWVSADAIINDFRTAYAVASPERKVEMVQALTHGLERTSSFFGDKNAAVIAANLTRILTQTKSQAVETATFDIAGLPLITTARLLVKGAAVAAELGKPANVAKQAGNVPLATEIMASDALKGTKISGMTNDEIARQATSLNMTPMEMSFNDLKVAQPLQDKLRAVAQGLRERISSTLMPSSVTPAQVSRGADFYDDLYDTVRNKSVYEYTPTDYKEGYFTGEIKWQNREGNPFATREAAEAWAADLGKQGEAIQVGRPWQVGEEPIKVGSEKRVYAVGGELDVTGKVVGGKLPERPSDTGDTFYLFGAVKRDKQGRYYYTQQQYAVPGQSWVFKETVKNPLPLESIGTHTIADVAGRNWFNFLIPGLAASTETVTQRGLGRSAQAKIARDFTNEYKAATKGLSAKEHSLVDKALIDGDALSNAAGSTGYVFDAVELGARGLSDKGIESYYRQRILRDTSWLFRERTLIHEAKTQGLMELAFDGNEFAPALHMLAKPMSLGTMKSMATQGKVGKVLNTVDGVVINLTAENLDKLYTGGGQIVKLQKPQVISGRKYSHVIIDSKQARLREVTNILGYRPGEFSRMYKDEYMIFLKKFVEDEFGRKYGMAGYEGEVSKTMRTAPSASKAAAYVKAHNEAIKIAISETLDDTTKLKLLEQQIGKYTNASEFLDDVKRGKINAGDEFDFHYTRETHSYLADTVDENLTNGRLFYSKRGEKLLSTDPDRVNTLDIKQSLGIELANIARFMTSEDIRVTAIERWMNSFGDGLVLRSYNKMADFINSPLDASKIREGLLAKKERGELSAVEDLTQLSSPQLLKFAESERAYIKNQLHLRTAKQKIWEEDHRRTSEWIQDDIGKFFGHKTGDYIGATMRQKNVPDFLRSANYQLSLAMGNPSQLIVQANGALVATGIHPIHALPSVKTAALLRLALMSDNPNVWKTVGTFDSLTSLGFKNVQEFVDSVKAIKNSGILSDIRSTALYNVEDGALDLYKSWALEKLSNISSWPFNRGEEFARLVSWEIARRVWAERNPGKAWQSADGLRDISARQKEFNLGMQAHNTAPWQQGWLGVPFQFLQYNIKLTVAQMHTAAQLGKNIQKEGWKAVYNFDNGNYRMFNPREALMLLGTQLLFLGAAGNGVRYIANGLWGKADTTEEQRMYIAEGLFAGLIYTVTKEMDGGPVKLALGTRLGSFNWYGQIYDKIVADKFSVSDFLFGVTKSNGVKVFDHVRDLARLFYYQQPTPELVMDTLSKFPEVVASYSNALKAYTYMQKQGVVTDKEGTAIARINKLENLAAFIGLSSVQIQEYYETVKDSQHLYKTLNELAKQVYSLQMRERDAIEKGDTKLAADLEQLRWVMLDIDPAHRRYVVKQLRDKLWPGDTKSDQIRRKFQEQMNDAVNEFRVIKEK